MDLLRSFISLFNRPGDTVLGANTVDLSIPVCYYGHTYVAQPNSDELRRAAFILESRNKTAGKNFAYLLACYDEYTIVLRDNSRCAVRKFEIRKIVVSCVDAKHQRLLAMFYDNDSSESSMGMECHLFLCRTKMVAKMAANKIGEKLNKLQFKSSEKLPPKIKLDQVNIMTRPNVSDFDYENISRFFREEVFNLSVQDPSSESSSTYLTAGCDSGRASTVASVDTKSEEVSRDYINPIQEGDELEPEVNMMESYKVNPRVKELLNESRVVNHENYKKNKSIRKNIDPTTSPIDGRTHPPITVCGKTNRAKQPNIKNRYSEQYELMGNRSRTNECIPNTCNDNKINKKYSSERYSHQYELMGTSRKSKYDETNYENISDFIIEKENRKVIERKLNETASNKKEGNDISTTKQPNTDDTSRNIQNRYSVHYDLQDEMIFNEDDEDVFRTHNDEPTPFSDIFSTKDFALRKIDKKELHRLTYMSSTDI